LKFKGYSIAVMTNYSVTYKYAHKSNANYALSYNDSFSVLPVILMTEIPTATAHIFNYRNRQ